MTAAQTEPAAPAPTPAKKRVPYAPDPRVRWGLPAALLAVVAVAVVWMVLVAIVKAAALDENLASLIVWVVTYAAVIVAAVLIAKNRAPARCASTTVWRSAGTTSSSASAPEWDSCTSPRRSARSSKRSTAR